MFRKKPYYPDYSHLSENRSMPFSEIALSISESIWLSVSRFQPIFSQHAARLIDLDLVEGIFRTGAPGSMPIHTDTYRISSRGIAFYRFRRHDSTRYWITTLIALAALIKAFLPEILELWAWLSRAQGQ